MELGSSDSGIPATPQSSCWILVLLNQTAPLTFTGVVTVSHQ